MKLIKPSFEILEQGFSIDDIYKHIELCGRTCYKSADKITKDSAKPFVDEIIIVDTGSTDSSKMIAAQYTDKIYDFNKVEDRLEYLKLHEGARF